MPELPEVTVIVNSLNRKIRGLVLESIEYDWPKKFYWNGFSIKDLKGAKVVGVRRWGKVVIIDLKGQRDPSTTSTTLSTSSLRVNSGTEKKKSIETYAQSRIVHGRSEAQFGIEARSISIVIHLKLTGQLIYQDAKTRIAGGHPIPPLNLPSPNKTTRATFEFDNGGHLYFNDMRKFGWVKIVESDESKVKEAIGAELGPDPLVMSYEQFRERLKAKGKGRIKKTLMDQTFISGVGNIYSDESLWRAKIHPARSVESLSEKETKALFEGLKESLQLAIEKGGSSANSFVDSGGEKGLFLSFAKAYHMTGRPCARCKTPIARKKMDGRSAHFCPNCQRLR